MTTLNTIIKDSTYKLTQFSQAQIENLEKRIFIKKETPHVECLVRKTEIPLKPEEVVRQLYIEKLNQEFGYPFSRMKCEWAVQQGEDKTSKRADIVIFDIESSTTPYIIVEVKQHKVKDGKEQLKSYCLYSGAAIGVWTNGEKAEYFFKRQDPDSKTTDLDGLTYLPKANQTLAEILDERFTIKNLMLKDKLLTKSLRDVILEFEHVVLANSGVNSFEEIFKLIFTKLFDELQSGGDKDELMPQLKHVSLEDIDDKNFRALEFRNSGTDSDVKKRLEKLFEGARQRWEGIFPEQCSFALTPYHLNTCVSYLQDVKLFNSNLEVVDEAFEYLVNQESKGNRGQYFTPRYVIDACVKMLNPKSHETLIDTAAGSCGFPMHAIFHVWQQLNPEGINLFTTEKRTPAQKAYVQDKVFAIDFDTRVVRVGRTLNLIAGDGQTNVIELNTLDFKRWNHTVNQSSWIDIYNDARIQL